jgi:hypothetical protein
MSAGEAAAGCSGLFPVGAAAGAGVVCAGADEVGRRVGWDCPLDSRSSIMCITLSMIACCTSFELLDE